MEQNAVTTQPLQTSQYTEKMPTEVFPMFNSNVDTVHNIEESEPLKEKFSESENPTDSEEKENIADENKKKKQESSEEVTDCCCVYAGLEESDPFCMYLLCNLICDCFRGLGECTDSCFEHCATCLSHCCEDSSGNDCCGGCSDCSDGGNCCSDCLTGCLECGVSCDMCSD